MKKWRCKSRIILGEPCKYHCEAETDFQPRGCLWVAVFEEWEPVEEKLKPAKKG
jgi:hypothetical protein